MLLDSLKNCIKSAKKKNWNLIYIAIDIHDTIIEGNYSTTELPTNFLANSKEVLQYLSNRKDIVLILYTCSHRREIEKYYELFIDNKIYFRYCNENPEVPDNALGCYTNKLYFNLLLDDKAGFNPNTDWTVLHDFFKENTLL